MLVFLHLSDLHFTGRPRTSPFELDEKLRHEIELDAPGIAKKLGGTTAILVSGDVAFSGQEDEYRNAKEWLTELSGRLGIGPENVWVIPGNHDVNWNEHERLPDSLTKRSMLREVPLLELDRTLDAVLHDPETAVMLMGPLKEYLTFAAEYDCPSSIDELAWNTPFELGAGYRLVIRGLNSALISGPDDDTNTKKLVVGTAQTQLFRRPGIVYLTMCHHPPSWIRDSEQLQTSFDSDAAVQITGHTHNYSVEVRGRSVCVSSGAAHPERHKKGWEPRYNFLTVDLIEAAQPEVEIVVHPRVWKLNRFVDAYPGVIQRHRVRLDDAARLEGPAEELGPTINDPTLRYRAQPPDLAAEQIANPSRRLAFRISSLRDGYRLSIAAAIGLPASEAAQLDARKLADRLIRYAEAEEKLADLWDATEFAHGRKDPQPNPYRAGG